jgi:hypothetical protein
MLLRSDGRGTGPARPPTPQRARAPSTRTGGVQPERPRGIRGAITRTVGKIPFLRRFYVRRLLRYMEKAKSKGRPLPSQLRELDANLSRLRERDRAAALEEALQFQGDDWASRELRRAAARQQRQRGTGRGRRPGAVITRAPAPGGPRGQPPPGPRRSRPR